MFLFSISLRICYQSLFMFSHFYLMGLACHLYELNEIGHSQYLLHLYRLVYFCELHCIQYYSWIILIFLVRTLLIFLFILRLAQLHSLAQLSMNYLITYLLLLIIYRNWKLMELIISFSMKLSICFYLRWAMGRS